MNFEIIQKYSPKLRTGTLRILDELRNGTLRVLYETNSCKFASSFAENY